MISGIWSKAAKLMHVSWGKIWQALPN